jgi:hypothetical protein
LKELEDAGANIDALIVGGHLEIANKPTIKPAQEGAKN